MSVSAARKVSLAGVVVAIILTVTGWYVNALETEIDGAKAKAEQAQTQQQMNQTQIAVIQQQNADIQRRLEKLEQKIDLLIELRIREMKRDGAR